MQKEEFEKLKKRVSNLEEQIRLLQGKEERFKKPTPEEVQSFMEEYAGNKYYVSSSQGINFCNYWENRNWSGNGKKKINWKLTAQTNVRSFCPDEEWKWKKAMEKDEEIKKWLYRNKEELYHKLTQ